MTEEAEHSTAIIAVKSTFLCIFIVAAIVGNGSVIYAIKNFRKLRTVPNYFVFNLAISDLLFSLIGMPMILVTTLAEGWILGDVLCNASGFLNSLLCTVSIWTLAMISVNRYYAVAKARDIKKIYTKRRSLYIIGGVWLFSIIVSAPPLIGWSEFIPGSNFCTVNGKKHLSYAAILLSVDYIIPLIVLSGLYMRIFCLLRKHESIMKQRSQETYGTAIDYKESSFTSEADSVSSGNNHSITKQISLKGKKMLSELSQKNMNSEAEVNKKVVDGDIDSIISESAEIDNNKNLESKTCKSVSISENLIASTPTLALKRRKKGTIIKKFFKEARVTKMLLIVVMGFFLCWTPFMIASVLYGLGAAPSGFQLMTLGIMFACLNSIINPFIYAVMNRNFRFAFESMGNDVKNIICLR